MCNNFPNIRITEGNNFSLVLPLRSRTYVATKPIDEDIDLALLQNIVVTFGGVEYQAIITEGGVQIDLPATLAVGTYNILLTANYLDSSIRAAYESAVTIVPWSAQSTAEQYIAGSPIVLRAAYVLSGAMTDAELEELKAEFRERNAELAQATADMEAAKQDYIEKAAALDGVAQQSTLIQGVANIREDISHIDIDTTFLAKETTAEAAKQAALDAKAAAQALSPFAQAAEAYNEGKPALAEAITAKGVESAASDSLVQMAAKVSLIAQEPIIWDDGDISHIYERQLFGSLETPNYWNLYEILAYLLSDHYLRQDAGHVGERFGGFLLAEYYSGYPDLALSGVGAGGAYVVSDIDPQTGRFKAYYTDTTHTWNTEFDGKGNKWVAYCFADEYHDFQITDTNISPRSIFIGRKVGTITSLTNGRVSQIVVPDGNKLLNFNTNTFAQNFTNTLILCNIENLSSPVIYGTQEVTEKLYIRANSISGTTVSGTGNGQKSAIKNIIIQCDSLSGTTIRDSFGGIFQLQSAIIYSPYIDNYELAGGQANIIRNFKEFHIFTEQAIIVCPWLYSSTTVQLPHIDYPTINLYYISNDSSRFVRMKVRSSYMSVGYKVLLQRNWCKPLDVSILTDMTESQLYSNILQRLKQDEPDCGDGVTITLGSTNLAKLTSAESVQLLDNLTNIYGYTFA